MVGLVGGGTHVWWGWLVVVHVCSGAGQGWNMCAVGLVEGGTHVCGGAGWGWYMCVVGLVGGSTHVWWGWSGVVHVCGGAGRGWWMILGSCMNNFSHKAGETSLHPGWES